MLCIGSNGAIEVNPGKARGDKVVVPLLCTTLPWQLLSHTALVKCGAIGQEHPEKELPGTASPFGLFVGCRVCAAEFAGPFVLAFYSSALLVGVLYFLYPRQSSASVDETRYTEQRTQ